MALTCALLMSPAALFAQGVAVRGTVTDENGPLAGVVVTVQGTKTVAITDADGNYSIAAGENGVLEFTCIGYKKASERVGERTTVNAEMEQETLRMNEVVVVGYGTQRREAVTGSVATLRGAELAQNPSGNITQAIQGRVAGVEMTQTSSRPGAEMQIRIRGMRSLTASNDPLVVLDGIPFAGTLGDINPSDIRSMDILKDASATAIYGSRGANGVILITTVKGAQGQKATVTYNGYYGVKNAIKVPMMDGPTFAKLRAVRGQFSNDVDEADDVNTDWQDLLYRTGVITSHDFNVSGGTATGAYSFGGSYYHDQAVIPTQNYTRYSWRANAEQGVKMFRFGLTSNNNYNTSHGMQLGMYGPLNSSPLANPYNADGTLKRTVRMNGSDVQYVLTRQVLEDNEDAWRNDTRAFGSYNTLFGEVSIPYVEGLKYRVNVGANFNTRHNGTFTGIGIGSSNETTESSAANNYYWTINWAVENLLTYDKTFAEKHNVSVVGLYSAEQTTYSRFYASARGIPIDELQYWNLGLAEQDPVLTSDNQAYQQSGLLSYMGRVMYSYDDRYMLSAAIRSDGSSRLAPGHKWHTYPAVSVGWNIHKEEFMSGIEQLNSLKLRAGFGQTSNQAVDPYKTLGELRTRPYNFGDTHVKGYYVDQLPNIKLGWEFSTTYNFGLDFSVLNNRLWGTMEYYVQKTDNVLQGLNLPPTSGVSSYTANIGKTENKGFELTLNGMILNNYNGFSWEAGVNFYVNKNKLVELASGEKRDIQNLWFVGYPINSIYDYERIGLWQEGDLYMDIYEPSSTPGQSRLVPGDIRVKYTGGYDADGKPLRQIGSSEGADDRQVMSMDPDFQGGFNTRLSYKGIDLSVVGAFKSGGLLISSLYSTSGYLNMLSGRRGNVDVDYWTPENTGAKYPNPAGTKSNDNPVYGTTMGYFDASYLKIQTITLGYNVEPKWVKKAGVDRLRVYATVQNPFVFFSPYHNESGMDPEPNARGNDGSFSASSQFNANNSALNRIYVVGTNTPNTRNWLFGLNLTF